MMNFVLQMVNLVFKTQKHKGVKNQVIIFNAKSIIFNTKFIRFNTKFML